MKSIKVKKQPKEGQNVLANVLANVSPCQLDILRGLETAMKQSDLARAVGRKPSSVCRDLRKLKDQDLVIKDGNNWRLSNFYLSKKHYPGPEGYPNRLTPSGIEAPTELHNLAYTLKFWTVPEGWEKMRRPGTMFGMGLPIHHPNYNKLLADSVDKVVHNTQIGGESLNFHMEAFTVACQKPSVKIWLPDVTGDTEEEAYLIAFHVLLGFLPQLERRLKLPPTALYSHGNLNIKVSHKHAVFLKSVLGDAIKKELGKNHFEVYAPDGKIGIVFDQSHGRRPESIHVGYGPDPLDNLRRVEESYGPPDRVEKMLSEHAYDDNVPLPSEQWAAVKMIGAQVVDVNKLMTDWQVNLSDFNQTQKIFNRDFRKHTTVMGGYAEGTERSLEAAEKNAKAAEVLGRGLDRLDQLIALAGQDHKPASDLDRLKDIRRTYLSKRR